jgi:hypothetical protein
MFFVFLNVWATLSKSVKPSAHPGKSLMLANHAVGFSWAPVIALSCRPSSCTGSSSTTQTDTKRIEQLPGKAFFKTV